jgi:hypothetical protein
MLCIYCLARTDGLHYSRPLPNFRNGAPRGDFVYRKRYLEQSDAVEIDLGECSQLVYDTLRPTEKPLSTREIVEAAMVAKGLDSADVRTREMVQKAVLGTLNRLDRVELIEVDGNAAAWRVKDNEQHPR